MASLGIGCQGKVIINVREQMLRGLFSDCFFARFCAIETRPMSFGIFSQFLQALEVKDKNVQKMPDIKSNLIIFAQSESILPVLVCIDFC